jgi:type IV secretion system protein VirD4
VSQVTPTWNHSAQSHWGPRVGGPPEPPRPQPPQAGLHGCLWLLLIFFALPAIPAFAMFTSNPAGAFFVLTFFPAPLILTIVLRAVIRQNATARRMHEQAVYQQASRAWVESRPTNLIAASPDPVTLVRQITRGQDRKGSLLLGFTPDMNEPRVAPQNHGVLVLGPPQSGKTSGLIIPAVVAFPGPVVSTATKLDVLQASASIRSQLGRVWLFDPGQAEAPPEGVQQLRWSPLLSSRTRDGARAMARAMVSAAITQSQGVAEHFNDLATKCLATFLYAAALRRGSSMADVRKWLNVGDFEIVESILTRASRTALRDPMEVEMTLHDLLALYQMAPEERASAMTTTQRVVEAYGSVAVARSCMRPNFSADDFVRSTETVYIASSAQNQEQFAPLVVGLLDDIKEAVYRLNRTRPMATNPARLPVLFALDEAANIAPVKDLGRYVSEGGGQGLQVMACFQDLSQARARWGDALGQGFLSLFATKVVFSGIGDVDTLEALSVMAGDWDRPYRFVNHSTGEVSSYGEGHSSTSVSSGQSVGYSSQRERLLSPSEISNIPRGTALTVRAHQWGLVVVGHFWSAAHWQRVRGQFGGTLRGWPPASEIVHDDVLDGDVVAAGPGAHLPAELSESGSGAPQDAIERRVDPLLDPVTDVREMDGAVIERDRRDRS